MHWKIPIKTWEYVLQLGLKLASNDYSMTIQKQTVCCDFGQKSEETDFEPWN